MQKIQIRKNTFWLDEAGYEYVKEDINNKTLWMIILMIATDTCVPFFLNSERIHAILDETFRRFKGNSDLLHVANILCQYALHNHNFKNCFEYLVPERHIYFVTNSKFSKYGGAEVRHALMNATFLFMQGILKEDELRLALKLLDVEIEEFAYEPAASVLPLCKYRKGDYVTFEYEKNLYSGVISDVNPLNFLDSNKEDLYSVCLDDRKTIMNNIKESDIIENVNIDKLQS